MRLHSLDGSTAGIRSTFTTAGNCSTFTIAGNRSTTTIAGNRFIVVFLAQRQHALSMLMMKNCVRQTKKRFRGQTFGIGDEVKKLQGIPCNTNLYENKSNGPKLLFNQSIHSLLIKTLQTNNNFNWEYMHTKDVVCTVLGKKMLQRFGRSYQ